MQDRTKVAPVADAPRIDLLDAFGRVRPLADIEADAIRLAIAHCGSSVAEAARLLGIGRSTIYRKAEGGSISLATPDEIRAAPRQAELLELIAEPTSAAEIARVLKISRQAVHGLLGKLLREERAVRLPSSRSNGWLYVRVAREPDGAS